MRSSSPGLFLAVAVLAVNMLGDGLRDTLDPSMAKAQSDMEDTEPVLEIRGLTVALPRRRPTGAHAVEDVSLRASTPGEIVCVVGECGSGKSVTAFAIMGLLPPELTRDRRARSCSTARIVLQPRRAGCGDCAASAWR